MKLEIRSPAIAEPPTVSPVCHPTPNNTATIVVATIEQITPRTVFELPNKGLPSNHNAQKSIG